LVPELAPLSSNGILGSLFRMTVDQYERLVESGVLDSESIELINGYLVKKMGKNPPHSWTVDAVREEFVPILPRGWSIRQEQPVKIPEFDEPEPDLAIVRGTRDRYEDRHPGPADIGVLIEVADTTLDRDRGEKQLVYARCGVPIYWIVNLVDRQLEIYTGPTPSGYRKRQVLAPNEQVTVTIGRRAIGRIAVSAILPRDRARRGAEPGKTP
jgi:Uma2 family endonuclease